MVVGNANYGVGGREQGWINATIQMHDIFCGCNDPILHMVNLAAKKGGIFGFDTNKAQKILQCLHTTTEPVVGHGETHTDDGDDGPEGNLEFGELEKLFEEDSPLEENDDTG